MTLLEHIATPASRLFGPLRNLRIGRRLGLSFAAVFVLMCVMAVFATVRMAEMNNRVAQINQNNGQLIAGATLLNEMTDSVRQRGISVRNLTLLTDPGLKKAELLALEESANVYAQSEAELLAMFERSGASEPEKALLEAIKRSEKTSGALMAQAIELAVADKTADAVSLLIDKVQPRDARWVKVLQTLSGLQAKTGNEYAADAAAAYRKARLTLWALLGSALGLSAVLSWLVTRSITVPIREAVRLASTAASGDLTGRTALYRKDETGQLLTALQNMNENFMRVVKEVRASSENIASGTSQIATGNGDLSQRTERQAASLEKTAASMAELRSTVQNNSQTAAQASTMAETASAAVSRGGTVFGEVEQTMGQITAASKRISDIIGVIDGIAFQTNILALNAAVEAARAGEQGRGFAVVASEVRSLAQRSAAAAREIKSLIGTSAESVATGSRLVGTAGATMLDITNQVRRVAALIGEISSASCEQTSGINEVSDAVTDLDRVTQQNAALVEQSAAAAESLKQQAAGLLTSVSVFKLDPQAA